MYIYIYTSCSDTGTPGSVSAMRDGSLLHALLFYIVIPC